jgi:hypothetical protein
MQASRRPATTVPGGERKIRLPPAGATTGALRQNSDFAYFFFAAFFLAGALVAFFALAMCFLLLFLIPTRINAKREWVFRVD